MDIHLIDGTYELFRHYHAMPLFKDAEGREVAAVKGVVASVLAMIKQGTTHVGVATDHVIESFRNRMWRGYKTSAGVEQDLLSQFPLLEEALTALGVTVWPMVEFEADDALAAAAVKAAQDPRVGRVFICTPDKDLAQCVSDPRVVMLDRRRGVLLDEAGVRAKYGVPPESIPDWLALVGDSADGYPGLPGWGAKSAAAVLTRYRHVVDIPDDATAWDLEVRGAAKLASTLAATREAANLFVTLATLRTDGDEGTVDDWLWRGPTPEFGAWAERLGRPRLAERAARLAEKRD